MKTEKDFFYKKIDKFVHPKIFSQEKRNFALGLPSFLDDIKGLAENKHQRFILACYHYARSLKEVGIDSEMVFIRLVSTIEALSSHNKISKRDDIFKGLDLKNLIKKNSLTRSQLKELTEIFNVRKSRIKFIRFIQKYSTGSIKGGKWKAKHLKIKKADLPKVLTAIYKARSAYLHKGEPMYLSQFFIQGFRNWDMDPSLGMIIDNRKFLDSQKLPYTYWFENIVRTCLLNYLKDNQDINNNNK